MSSDDEAVTMEIHSTMSKEKLRKLTKPLMEKRRRARINSCLNQLKNLVLQAMNQNTSHFSKLEKADILEMTVKHLSQLQRRQTESHKHLEGCGLARFRAGYSECAQEVARCLATVDDQDNRVAMRLMEHLAQRIQPSFEAKSSAPLRSQISTLAPPVRTARHAPLLLPGIPPLSSPQVDVKLTYSEYLQNIGAERVNFLASSVEDSKLFSTNSLKGKKVVQSKCSESDKCPDAMFNPDKKLLPKSVTSILKTDPTDPLEPVWRPW